jgi:chromosome condensin MukBEF MukE localization factor
MFGGIVAHGHHQVKRSITQFIYRFGARVRMVNPDFLQHAQSEWMHEPRGLSAC